jgi:hypothetical protein
MAKTPDEIVADIDRRQAEEDLDLVPRAGRMLKEKLNEDLTGGAYVGSRLNMGKLYDKSVGARAEEALNEGKTTLKDKIKTDINNSVQLYKQGLGMKSEPLKDVNYKKGGKVKSPTMKYETYTKTGKPAGMKTVKVSGASKRADGCCVKGKTKGKYL